MPEKRNDLIVVAVLIMALAIIVPLLTWGGMGWMGRMGMMGYGGGAMILVPITFIILLVIGAYFLLTTMTGSRGNEVNRQNKALEALKERYAKGEITKEQYLEMKEAMGA
jgi:putative membrane protein